MIIVITASLATPQARREEKGGVTGATRRVDAFPGRQALPAAASKDGIIGVYQIDDDDDYKDNDEDNDDDEEEDDGASRFSRSEI